MLCSGNIEAPVLHVVLPILGSSWVMTLETGSVYKDEYWDRFFTLILQYMYVVKYIQELLWGTGNVRKGTRPLPSVPPRM